MTNLKQIQEENRKLILTAIHGCDYEEALEKEFGVGCFIEIKAYKNENFYNPAELIGFFWKDTFVHQHYEKLFILREGDDIYSIEKKNILENRIVGKPLTLDRILLALEDKHFGLDTCELEPKCIWIYTKGSYEEWISWDLTKPTLEDQSKETQIAVYKLLGGENEAN